MNKKPLNFLSILQLYSHSPSRGTGDKWEFIIDLIDISHCHDLFDFREAIKEK